MPSFIQSATQAGVISRPATTDLTGKEGCFAKLVDGTGDATASLAGAGELALYVVEDASNTTLPNNLVSLRPLSGERNVRIIAAAALTGGQEVQSDANGQAVAASTGNWVNGVTEEDAVVGQYALIRPVHYKK